MIKRSRQQNSEVENAEHIFVYGSLRESMHHPMRNLLVRHGTLIGTGSFQGRLYDLGRYPGAVPSGSRYDRVRGEVFRLTGSQHVLALLDDYEGRRFKRQVVTIDLDDDDKDAVTCWAYMYTRSVVGRVYIASGDYVQYRRFSEREF